MRTLDRSFARMWNIGLLLSLALLFFLYDYLPRGMVSCSIANNKKSFRSSAESVMSHSVKNFTVLEPVHAKAGKFKVRKKRKEKETYFRILSERRLFSLFVQRWVRVCIDLPSGKFLNMRRASTMSALMYSRPRTSNCRSIGDRSDRCAESSFTDQNPRWIAYNW